MGANTEETKTQDGEQGKRKAERVGVEEGGGGTKNKKKKQGLDANDGIHPQQGRRRRKVTSYYRSGRARYIRYARGRRKAGETHDGKHCQDANFQSTNVGGFSPCQHHIHVGLPAINHHLPATQQCMTYLLAGTQILGTHLYLDLCTAHWYIRAIARLPQSLHCNPSEREREILSFFFFLESVGKEAFVPARCRPES